MQKTNNWSQSDYSIIEKIDETISAVVFRGKRDSSDEAVIIKALKVENPSPSEVARFKQEYELIMNFYHKGVVRTLDIQNYNGNFALIQEDFDGITLKKAIDAKKFDIETFINIAIDLSDSLGSLHKQNIIHKDIKPYSILYNSKTGEAKITNFGICSTEVSRFLKQVPNSDLQKQHHSDA